MLRDGRAVWATNTPGQAVRAAVMQGDGNLVLYGYDNRAVWASGVTGVLGSILVMQDDGNLVTYGSQPIWATGTNQ